jgi:hypothetical protein
MAAKDLFKKTKLFQILLLFPDVTSETNAFIAKRNTPVTFATSASSVLAM